MNDIYSLSNKTIHKSNTKNDLIVLKDNTMIINLPTSEIVTVLKFSKDTKMSNKSILIETVEQPFALPVNLLEKNP